MGRVGARFRRSNVRAVVFVHGTFAGADPLSIGKVARALPAVGAAVHRLVRSATKSGIDTLLGDSGTFGDGYASLFAAGIGGDIPCTRFVWSSENHHAARLEGTLDLVRTLATHARFGPRFRLARKPRVLLFGHSHGAQLFALMSHLLEETPEAHAIFDILRARGEDLAPIHDALRAARRVGIDIVTLGTPPRYPWAAATNMRVMHVVNARSDYVRRLGARGSDLPSLSSDAREINTHLDRIFGAAGLDPVALVQNAASAPAVDAHGATYFVEHASTFGALAGHSVYTKVDAMLFHALLASAHFHSRGEALSSPCTTAGASREMPRTLP
jgi:hypothetical protein